MKKARACMAFALALCLCASVTACGGKENTPAESQNSVVDNGSADESVEEVEQKTEVSIEQIEDFTSGLWDMDINDADKNISEGLGINTDKKEFHDSADDDDTGFYSVYSQTYTYDLADSLTEVLGVPCKEVSIYAPYDKEDKDSSKPVDSITFEFDGAAEDGYSKLNSEMVKAYGDGAEGKFFTNNFLYWNLYDQNMMASVYPPTEDNDGFALKFEVIEK